MATKKKKSSRFLKKKAWSLLSSIVRLENSDSYGYCACVTCGVTRHWTEMQAGHFIPKAQGNSVYFLEDNIHVQCVKCNIFLGGNLTNYTSYMIDRYGNDGVERLRGIKNEKVKISVQDYEDMIRDFKKRLVQLK